MCHFGASSGLPDLWVYLISMMDFESSSWGTICIFKCLWIRGKPIDMIENVSSKSVVVIVFSDSFRSSAICMSSYDKWLRSLSLAFDICLDLKAATTAHSISKNLLSISYVLFHLVQFMCWKREQFCLIYELWNCCCAFIEKCSTV